MPPCCCIYLSPHHCCLDIPASCHTCQTGSSFWFYQFTGVEFPHPCGWHSLKASHHTPSQFASQRSSYSLGPDCIPSTTSFSQEPWWEISDEVNSKSGFGIILPLLVAFSGTLLWKWPCKHILLMALKIRLSCDEDKGYWFSQPPSLMHFSQKHGKIWIWRAIQYIINSETSCHHCLTSLCYI